jgi:glycosyltransferase involved in cell wall biosynthesis
MKLMILNMSSLNEMILKNIIKYYEFTRLNIPVICPDIEPYKEIVTHNDNGVLCSTKESWLFEMETFLKDKEKYNGLKDRAYASILESEISDPDNLKILMEVYEI